MFLIADIQCTCSKA